MKMLRDFITKDIVTAQIDTPLRDVISVMRNKNVSSVLIVSDTNKILGIFTERDIAQLLFSRKFEIHVDSTIGSLMRTNVVTIDFRDSIMNAVDLMVEKKIRHLPVTNNDFLVGMISIRDAIKAYHSEIQVHSAKTAAIEIKDLIDSLLTKTYVSLNNVMTEESKKLKELNKIKNGLDNITKVLGSFTS